MLAACGAQGITVIDNPAREPEIVDLQGFLRSMGAQVSGAGTGEITIQGGCRLHAGEYTVMADRIVAATYLCAVAAAGGEGELLGTQGEDLGPVLAALEAAGCETGRAPNRLWIRRRGPLGGVGSLCTGPYPAFPTDAQPLLAAALAGGTGKSRITETIFDRRFRYTEGLCGRGHSGGGGHRLHLGPAPPRGPGGGHRPSGGRRPHRGGSGRPGAQPDLGLGPCGPGL